eukprot:TRINITY_DN5854_c0_g1_i1.p1 TRINITY_DN5854_c0_g1~~TRINITY_DN5854_c0_g1_i1.p1  ORF type:complete len:509 (-),score=118.05 TRINITY_DN5854_c0_g1_i1:85-1611(-)
MKSSSCHLVVVLLALALAVSSCTANPLPRHIRRNRLANLSANGIGSGGGGGSHVGITSQNYTGLTYTQKVDHFNPTSNVTFEQRYTVNTTFYREGGPIFFFLSGEAPMEFFEFQEVQILVWAQKFGAVYVVLEHRYYGKSIPTPDYSTENMQYLSSEQALVDAAQFIDDFNQTLTQPTQKAVVFGCSYSGALSSFFRIKYPHLVVGSIAPSGPVQAFNNFTQYFSQFYDSAAPFPGCADSVTKATTMITDMAQNSTGLAQIAQLFNACTVPESPEDFNYFAFVLLSTVGSADQFQNPPLWPMNQTCGIMLQSGDIVQNFVDAFNYNLNFDPAASNNSEIFASANSAISSGSCNDFTLSGMIMSTNQTSLEANSDGSRSWMWQVCTEFGWFQDAYPGTSPFFTSMTFDVQQQIDWCAEFFDLPHMTPNVDFTNEQYGGWGETGTNILFTNGLYDPWHYPSIHENTTNGIQAATYEAGHCAPLTAATAEDPISLIHARQAVEDALSTWLI